MNKGEIQNDEQIPIHEEFKINVNQLQDMFTTENISTGQSMQKLKELGGVDGLALALQSDLKSGINTQDDLIVSKRKEIFGDNTLKPPELESFFHFMAKQTEDFCIRILAAASLFMFMLAFISEDPFESIVQALSILIAILAVVIIGALTDFRKEKQFIQLYMEQEMENVKYFNIFRNGRRLSNFTHFDILVGDIVEIVPGDSLSFDGVLVRGSTFLDIDESMITGVSNCIKKRPFNDSSQIISEKQGKSGIIEQQQKDCFLRAGSNVFEGYGCILVCAVGDNTYSNQEKKALNPEEEAMEVDAHAQLTPLQRSTTILAKYLVSIGAICAIVMFLILELYTVREIQQLKEVFLSQFTLRKMLGNFIDAFLIVVLSIPEGLPLIITLSMAFSIGRLKQNGIIIRNLHYFQVLGSVEMVCFDKTGTLTCNQLSTQAIYTNQTDYQFNQKQYPHRNSPAFRGLVEAILSNNTSSIKQDDRSRPSQIQKQSQIIDEIDLPRTGNRMDVALMTYLDSYLTQQFIEEYNSQIQKSFGRFLNQNEEKNNYSAVFINEKGNMSRIYIKGKPQDILEKCNRQAIDNSDSYSSNDEDIFKSGDIYQPQVLRPQPLTQQEKQDIQRTIRYYTENSLKCIAFACKSTEIQDDGQNQKAIDEVFESSDFVFLGLTGVRDEIRQDSSGTIDDLHQADIETIMMTGDTRINAVSVARKLGMISNQDAEDEIERKSEMLQPSSIKEFNQGDENDEQQQFIKQNISLKRDTGKVLNFQEYLKYVKEILKNSNKKHQDTLITEENCLKMIGDILQDEFALQQIKKLNKEIKLIADASQYQVQLYIFLLNNLQKQHFLQMLIGINESTIAYVGDGNNDARSLRTAQIGITLGTTATNIAKECSGVILLQDRLFGIAPCLKWGRNIFVNIKRFIYFQLSFYFTSIIIMLISSIIFKQQPFSVLQVIWLALVQDIFSAISLSTEPPQKNILSQTKPFKPTENLINLYLLKLIAGQVIFQVIITAGLLIFAPIIFGIEPSYLHDFNDIGGEFQSEWAVHFTIIYHVSALFQIANLLNARRVNPGEYNQLDGILDNKPLIYVLILITVIQYLIIYEGGEYFKTAKLTLLQNIACIIIASGSLMAFWLTKSIIDKDQQIDQGQQNLKNDSQFKESVIQQRIEDSQ